MRLIIAIILIALLSFAAEYFFSWWSLAVICFGVAIFLRLCFGSAFLAGFLGIFLLWFIVGALRDSANDHVLSSRMAQLFGLSGAIWFLLVASLVGGIVGGFAGWSGAIAGRYLFVNRS